MLGSLLIGDNNKLFFENLYFLVEKSTNFVVVVVEIINFVSKVRARFLQLGPGFLVTIKFEKLY